MIQTVYGRDSDIPDHRGGGGVCDIATYTLSGVCDSYMYHQIRERHEVIYCSASDPRIQWLT